MLIDPRLATELTSLDISILFGRGSSLSAAVASAPAPAAAAVPASSPSMIDLEICVLGSFIIFD